MANDGIVRIDITADDSDIKNKIDETEESLKGLGDEQKETQKETEKTTSKFAELAETIDKQEKELKSLKSEYIETAINLGENSKEAQNLKEKFSSLNAELKENKARFTSAADSLEDLEDNSKKSGRGFDIANIAIGDFISDGIQNFIGKVGEAISSLIALADETREYREDMAKLETAFKSAGHSTKTAQKAYDDFYKILGESDRSVEAVNHLAELTDNTEDVAKWSNIAAGVTAKFGDSLPIEGLTEAANETAKVGAVTGPLADALNWAGISEDAFNEKLKKCNSEQERATLITNTLNKEYEAAAAEYNTLTASTQAARDATNKMEQAQAAMGAQLEPLTTAWTNLRAQGLEAIQPIVGALATGVTNLTNSLINNKTAAGERAETARATLETIQAEAQAYKDLKVAQFEQSAADLAHIENAKLLYSELQTLVDENGRVTEANKARADFIVSTLSEALGIEMQMVGNQITGYQNLKGAINEAIAAKQAEILLANDLAAYTEALENRGKKEQEQADLLIKISDQKTNALKAETEYATAQQKYLEDVANAKTEADLRALSSTARTVEAKKTEWDKEKKALSDLETAYDTNEGILEGYYKDIKGYQDAQSLIMQGKTEEAINLLNRKNSGYYDSAKIIGEATEEEKKKLEDLAIATGVNAVLMRQRYEDGVEGVTEEMVKTAEKAAETAQTEFEKIGGQIGDGIGKGAEDKKPGLLTKIRNIISSMKKAAEDEADINSPSRVFRDEIGKMIVAGIEVGIEENADKPVEAVRGVFESMQKVLDDAHKDTVDTVKEYNAEITDLEKEKNKKLAELEEKFIADKKKKGADRAALEKQYTKDIENINEQHAEKVASIQENIKKTITDKMQEIVSLGDTYKENIKKIWEDLDQSIADLQANYDNQLASRTESIASSLNLWNKATKNKVYMADLRNNLQSQVDILEDYNEAIAKLEERNVSTAFINSLKEMGVGSTGEIESLAKMTDEQLSAYVELWEKKNELARNAAIEELEPLKAETEAKIEELTDAALDKYAELRAKYQEQGSVLMAELKQAMIDAGAGGYEEIIGQIDEYTSAGEDLMGGVIEGIANRSPMVANAVTSAVRRAIQAAKDAAGIASPSKVMKKEVGANLAEGMSVGWTDKIDAIKSKMAADMQGITTRIKTAVSLENARMAQGVGVRDTGFAEVAQAVGMQTAGINSLASEYRRGSSAQVTVPLILDGRELGRAIVDLGSAESERIGTNLVLA
jgi:hypothetical protein